MGVWYFLILVVGLFLIFKGLLMKKQSLLIMKIGILFVGLFCISFSIFMFSPGSAEIISDLLNWE
ncbi:hypothetical protein [Lysinibacillus xylanilyticus]|uniref:hypothetical protein n=1 Tax=Lysinibacillus xylanilyticus TaxID=582475 RepID=UPI003D048493